MPHNAPRKTRPKRIDCYVDEELYEWVHTQAARQRRSMSSWLGWVVAQLRDGLAPGTLPNDGAHAPTEEV